jgi:hypothetical protein
LHDDDLDTVVTAFDRSDEAMLNAMKALEFGAPTQSGGRRTGRWPSPGSCSWWARHPSVLPFMFVEQALAAMWWATVLTGIGLFAVGAAKTRVTGRTLWWQGSRTLRSPVSVA